MHWEDYREFLFGPVGPDGTDNVSLFGCLLFTNIPSNPFLNRWLSFAKKKLVVTTILAFIHCHSFVTLMHTLKDYSRGAQRSRFG